MESRRICYFMDDHSKPVTRLLFARHGETEASRANVFSGSTDIPLTSYGFKQAEALAGRLSSEHVDALYCSTQLRAIQTATPTALALNLEIQKVAGLREMGFGEWEMRTRTELNQEFPREMEIWENGTWMVAPPGGETQQEVVARATSCLLDLLKRHTGQTLLIFAHRTTIRLLLSNILDMNLPNSRALGLDPTGVTEVRIKGSQAYLLYHNDTRHLAELAR
jgi:broad specificity phosphatase PhoE